MQKSNKENHLTRRTNKNLQTNFFAEKKKTSNIFSDNCDLKNGVKVDARSSLGVPQDFAGMVGLAGGGHLYGAVPQQESE